MAWSLHITDATAGELMAASLDTYEAAARAVSELEWTLARSARFEPLSTLAATCADITRDATAVQLSTARWLLDL
ncbi:MAG TPA: hypothetical protein VKT31_01710 [Solirubrobacteraceae bacterium]|nr:hypothetical protein [Solirubrobacteraceae bacterium]